MRNQTHIAAWSLIGIILLLLIGWALWSLWGGTPTIPNTGPNDNGSVATSTDGMGGSDSAGGTDDNGVTYWRYTSDALGFSIWRPAESEVQMEGEGRVKFLYLGPDSQPNTEVTDGFTLTISKDIDTNATSVSAYAAEVFADRSERYSIERGLEQRSVSGMTAYRFTHESELGGSVTEYVFLPAPGIGFIASYSIADPNEADYGTIVFTMLEHISFDIGSAVFTDVDIALLDTSGTSTGEVRGCDRVVMVTRSIDPTQAPLTAAMNELFTTDEDRVDGYYHFISKTNDTLRFDHASVSGGVAHIYLEGSLSGLAGVCDNPRAQIQIEETALQFSSVDSVQIYLNGTPTDLTPSEQ